jgi:hypothetical protein
LGDIGAETLARGRFPANLTPMETPRPLDEAQAAYQAEKAKVKGALSTLIGSRWLLAVVATFAIAFGCHLAYAPNRLPPVGGLNLTTAGLPPLDFGMVGEGAAKAREAAQREVEPNQVQAFIDENRASVPVWNAIGFGAAMLLLGMNLAVMTKRRRASRG